MEAIIQYVGGETLGEMTFSVVPAKDGSVPPLDEGCYIVFGDPPQTCHVDRIIPGNPPRILVIRSTPGA